MKRSYTLVSSLAVLLLVGACGDEPRAASVAAPVAKKPAAKATATDAAAAPAYVYRYSPMGKRDPFRSPEVGNRAAGPGGGVACNEPLCQFDLDQLTLVAVVTGDSNPIAMVEDPQGRGFIVRRNSKMGKQGGKVSNILRDQVVVTEYWQQPDGKVTPNPVSLKLKGDSITQPAMDLLTGQYQP